MFDLAQFVNRYAGVDELRDWAWDIMDSRRPDQTIEDEAKRPYMHRWFVVPRNEIIGGVFLHRIVRSDKDVPHDHPWDNTSLVLDGHYREDTLLRDGSIHSTQCRPGSVVKRSAWAAHRLVLESDYPVTTLFIVGIRLRDWGFHCKGGWVPWREFVDPSDRGKVGRGCGDLG